MFLQAGIPVGTWGQGRAKSLIQLLEEVEKGLTTIEAKDGKFRRRMRIAKVRMTRGNMVLVESHEKPANGPAKPTWQLVSVKIRTAEDPRAAALRGVQSELDLEEVKLSVKMDVHHESKFAPSYPGLSGFCEYFTFEADGSALPLQDFKTYDYDKLTGDVQTTHFWTWRSREEWAQMAAQKRSDLEKGDTSLLQPTEATHQAAGPMNKGPASTRRRGGIMRRPSIATDPKAMPPLLKAALFRSMDPSDGSAHLAPEQFAEEAGLNFAGSFVLKRRAADRAKAEAEAFLEAEEEEMDEPTQPDVLALMDRIFGPRANARAVEPEVVIKTQDDFFEDDDDPALIEKIKASKAAASASSSPTVSSTGRAALRSSCSRSLTRTARTGSPPPGSPPTARRRTAPAPWLGSSLLEKQPGDRPWTQRWSRGATPLALTMDSVYGTQPPATSASAVAPPPDCIGKLDYFEPREEDDYCHFLQTKMDSVRVGTPQWAAANRSRQKHAKESALRQNERDWEKRMQGPPPVPRTDALLEETIDKADSVEIQPMDTRKMQAMKLQDVKLLRQKTAPEDRYSATPSVTSPRNKLPRSGAVPQSAPHKALTRAGSPSLSSPSRVGSPLAAPDPRAQSSQPPETKTTTSPGNLVRGLSSLSMTLGIARLVKTSQSRLYSPANKHVALVHAPAVLAPKSKGSQGQKSPPLQPAQEPSSPPKLAPLPAPHVPPLAPTRQQSMAYLLQVANQPARKRPSVQFAVHTSGLAALSSPLSSPPKQGLGSPLSPPPKHTVSSPQSAPPGPALASVVRASSRLSLGTKPTKPTSKSLGPSSPSRSLPNTHS